MNKRRGLNLVICGCGGQGNILASRIIADALMQREEHVKTAETIGMAQRGGSVASHVRGGHPQSPLVPQKCADTLIAFEPGEALRCIDYLAVRQQKTKEHTPQNTPALIVNTCASQPPTAGLQRCNYDGKEALVWSEKYAAIHGQKFIALNASEFCEEAGSAKVLNIVMLAAACKANALDGLTRQELEDAIKRRVKKHFWTMNLQAVEAIFSDLSIS